MDLEAIEAQRSSLENEMNKLRVSLEHWKRWEFEYEGLRAEFALLPKQPTESDIETLVKDISNDELTPVEVRGILFKDKNHVRSHEQVTNRLDRRIEYVQSHVKSLQKQLEKVAASARGIDNPTLDDSDGTELNFDDEGLPFTEIFEELDEEGNVISGRVSNPAENAEEVIASLRRAGVEADGPNDESAKNNAIAFSASAAEPRPQTDVAEKEIAAPEKKRCNSTVSGANLEPESSTPASHEIRPQAKSVSFADGTKEKSEEEKPFSTRHTMKSTKPTATPIVKNAFTQEDRVWEVDENDRPVNFSSPHIPKNETAEEAQMRREMLQYSMAEVGAIVAELQLEEGAEDSDGLYSDDDNISEVTDDSDEDEHGLSRRSLLTDDYKDEMLELEKKLNAQMVQNIGPTPDRQEIRSQIIVPPDQSRDFEVDAAKDKKQPQRGVRFAEDLDIAPKQHAISKNTTEPQPPISEHVTAVRDSVIERSVPGTHGQASGPDPPKVSRFKAARLVEKASTEASQAPNAPMAAEIVERPPRTVNGSHKPPREPDELDPELLRREVQADYYRQRNRLIKKQGGYRRNAEQNEDEDEDDEEEDDMLGEDAEDDDSRPQKKVSLFKAARINADRAW